jgi:hypothetical protein
MQFESRTHPPNLRARVKVVSMPIVPCTLPLGHEYLDALPNHLVTGIPEQSFSLGIDLDNDALLVYSGDSIRNSFQDGSRQKSLRHSFGIRLHVRS